MGGEPSRTYFRPWMYGYIIALCDEKEPVNLSMLFPSSLAKNLEIYVRSQFSALFGLISVTPYSIVPFRTSVLCSTVWFDREKDAVPPTD